MGNTRIRMAEESDAAALLDIYAPYVAQTPVSFETAVPDEAEFAMRIRNIRRMYPYLVCERGGTAIGYAYAGMH